ncbi:hypothetical protein PTKU46_43830 [Paraburkholderia terrae]|uniref:DUF1488 family protein n=1 Tax=Paraburkholderia terrae TaxID=311230 RepID=UPI00296B5012|nr:DUF1488 family protein [Paraburkholderia terrae]MDW3658379.1 DUF1488 family protein [Paraburkholderia terrae]
MANTVAGCEVAVLALNGFEQAELIEPRRAPMEAGATAHVSSARAAKIQGFRHVDKGDRVDIDATFDPLAPGHSSPSRDGTTTRQCAQGFVMNGIVKVFMPRAAYEDSLMHITFTDDAPVFDGSSLTVRFNACVDGEPVACAISAEALEDHFGADSPLEDALIGAYERGRARIRSVCAEALDQNSGESVILHSGLFRVEGMESDRRLKT